MKLKEGNDYRFEVKSGKFSILDLTMWLVAMA